MATFLVFLKVASSARSLSFQPALPNVLRQAFDERSLLFLGHGLAELAVEELIRHAAGPTRAWKSWAVQHPASHAEYWASTSPSSTPGSPRVARSTS